MKTFKLLQVLPSLALSEWIQPTYFDALAAVKQRTGGWGFPTNVRAARVCNQLFLENFTCIVFYNNYMR